MRFKIFNELIGETERIFMAGARLAPGDIRLKKQIETLEKLGEKSPLFAKLAEKFSALYYADEDSAAQALIEAAAMLQSVAAVMSDPAPDKPLTSHSGTLSYIKFFPLPYEVLHHMLVYLHAENKPIEGGYDYFLDPRLWDFIPAALKNYADEKTIPDEAIKKIGSVLLPPLTRILNENRNNVRASLCILRALQALSYPETYGLTCEIFDNGTY
jgi:hypothetical protein